MDTYPWFLFTVLLLGPLLSTSAEGLNVSVCSPEGPSSECLHVTLDEALQQVTSDSVVYLDQGIHYLERFTIIEGLNNVSLIGLVGEEEEINVTIRCDDGVGLAFVNVTELSLQNIDIDGCGQTGENLSASVQAVKQFVDLFYKVPIEDVSIGVFAGHCINLTMEHVTIRNTRGIGLVGINIIGNSLLRKVEFRNNVLSQPSNCTPLNASNILAGITLAQLTTTGLIGGGAYFLYQNYLPGYQIDTTAQHNLEIIQGSYMGNSECSYVSVVEAGYVDSMDLQDLGYSIGGGGGLTLILAQQEYRVDITVNSSLFKNNTARYGSGVHIGMFAGIRNTRMTFDSCTFLRNGVSRGDFISNPSTSFGGGGGGLSALLNLLRPNYQDITSSEDRRTSLELLNTSFIHNGARVGGGVIVESFFTFIPGRLSDMATLTFDRCTFMENNALIGAAMWILESKLNGRYPGIQIAVTDITVVNNTANSLDSRAVVTAQDNPAIIDIRAVNFTIGGNSIFARNYGTALQGSGSEIGIMENATVRIDNNIGVFGGAINLFYYSYLIVTANSSLYITNNTARVQGGAIYINFLGSNSAAFFEDCFLYFSYEDFTFCDNCLDLNNSGSYIEFSGNAATYDGDIIYGSALDLCPWATEIRQQYPNENLFVILNKYFPNVFNFTQKPTTRHQVTTTARQLEITDQKPSYSIAPGEAITLSLFAKDSFNQNISAVITGYATVNETIDIADLRGTIALVDVDGFGYVDPNMNVTSVSVQVFSRENRTISVVIYSFDCRAQAQVHIVAEVGFCPEAFNYNSTILSCVCNPLLVEREIDCDVSNQTLIVPNDLWVGPVEGELAVHDCVAVNCEEGIRYVSLRDDPVDYDVQCEEHLNRGGILCGSCKEGYSIVFGSNRCMKCENGNSGLIFIFLLLGILLITVISYFQVTITAGYLNGVIFYSNIVSLYAPLLTGPKIELSTGGFAPIYFLSLNLGIETCFHDGMSSLEKVWWQLSFPLYLVILMLITVGLARCCKWKRGAGFSTIQAFATLSLLCYVSVLDSCVELIGSVDIQTLSGRNFQRWTNDPSVTFFRGAHGLLAFVAILLLTFYIIPLPIILLFPAVLYRTRYLSKFKPFYDAFWNPFERKYRFWLGLRLIFRWIPFALVYLQPAPLNIFVTALLLVFLQYFQSISRPFIGFWRNALDSFFLLNLILLFTGGAYFRALAESNSGSRRDRAYSQLAAFSVILVDVAHVAITGILVYHILKRFPKLRKAIKNCFKRKKVEENVHVQQEQTSFEDNIGSDEIRTSNSQEAARVVTFSELREPLLETEGSLQIITLPSRPAQTCDND